MQLGLNSFEPTNQMARVVLDNMFRGSHFLAIFNDELPPIELAPMQMFSMVRG